MAGALMDPTRQEPTADPVEASCQISAQQRHWFNPLQSPLRFDRGEHVGVNPWGQDPIGTSLPIRHVCGMSFHGWTTTLGRSPSGFDGGPFSSDKMDRISAHEARARLIEAISPVWLDITSARGHMRTLRPGHVLVHTFILGFATIIVSGVGHALLNPVRGEHEEATQLTRSLIDGHATIDSVPGDFTEELGYQPLAQGPTLVNPGGGCSTPARIGPESFEDACRTHDLGYDTLRYAEVKGIPLGAWARFGLDNRLYSDLMRTCDTMTCRATATVYYTAVTGNSIRQGYVAPTAEPAGPWVGIALAVVGVGLVTTPGAFRFRDRVMSTRGHCLPAGRQRFRRGSRVLQPTSSS